MRNTKLHTPKTTFALMALLLGLGGLLFLSLRTPRVTTATPAPARAAPATPPQAAAPAPAAPRPSAPSPVAAEPQPAPAAGTASAQHADLLPAVEAQRPAPAALEARAEAAAFRIDVPLGGALITGGWRQPDGRRVLVLASPLSIDGDQVQVTTEFIAAPESALADPGWTKMLAQADGKLRLEGGVFDAEGLQAFRGQLASGSAFGALSSPRLTMRYDQLASIEISSVGNGLMMSLIATRRDDGRTVGLAVSTAEFHQPAPATTEEKP